MGHIGLQIRCNTFANSVNDIVIAKDGSASPNQGIALAQGLPAGPPAGNTFSNSIHNIVNDCLDINYYYDNSTSATIAAEEPMAVSLTYVVVRPETATKSCPSTLGDATSSPDGVRTISPITALDYSTLTTMKLAWYNNNARLINVVSVYNGLIDFGNTDSLEAIIAGSTDTTGLYKTLKGGSPYISEAALETAADDAALPYYSMMKIMKMNPDDLRDNNFITYMNGDYSFTTADMDTLLLYANNTTSRSVLEDSIALAHDTMDAMTNLIMMALKTPIDTNVSVNDTTGAGICLDTTSVYYGLDSNSIYLGLDSIDAWLKNIGNVWSRYERVGYYSFMGDNTTAASIFTAMGSEIPSISPDRTVYNTYANIEDVLFTAGTDSGKIYTLDSAQIAALDVTGQPGFTYNSASVVGFNISLAGRTGGGAVGPYPESLAIPCAAYMIVTDFPADRHGNGSAPQSPPPIININADYGNKQFSAYPNPTSGIVTFAYNVQDGTNGITIAITNIVGENVATIQTTNNNGSANWDPRTLPAGVYIYQASDVKGIISKGKIVVEK